MRHVALTCKNHPNLRWSCKEIAWSEGGYNGARGLHFMGEFVPDAEGKPQLYSDKSGTKTNLAWECPCRAEDLTLAPEDGEIKRAFDESEAKRLGSG